MAAFFVSIDGVDGCGKSTQTRLLQQWFDELGQPVLLVRDPGGTRLGESLREILLHRSEIPLTTTAEMLLYMASRAQLVEELIEPALADGCHVISDRFLLANVVYQGSAGGLDTEQLWQVGQIATRGRLPDLTFLLDLDATIAMARQTHSPDRLESRGLEYMQRVRQGYLTEGQRLSDQLIIMDATLPAAQIHDRITAEIVNRLMCRGLC